MTIGTSACDVVKEQSIELALYDAVALTHALLELGPIDYCDMATAVVDKSGVLRGVQIADRYSAQINTYVLDGRRSCPSSWSIRPRRFALLGSMSRTGSRNHRTTGISIRTSVALGSRSVPFETRNGSREIGD